ncbi:SURF1 family protein [Allorhizobium sp. BGMRC 0089]|uniref:SURF1 family protein n=1 Tax=Allorhizobium sonneratiae TaxID=2934936 RepID=UPI00203332D8|nr:SURF1 family protein [Allorhizobium sonneratiae]MCM2294492.1 SURF1 family protein [Allorhizobium sonneratiae]
MRTVRQVLSGFLLLSVLAVLVGLGTWQLQRLAWKEGLLAEIESRRHEPPLTVEAVARMVTERKPVDYRAMTATGTFQHDKERRFLATYDGRPGFYIYTPLTLADGYILFVNRGFVPDERKDPFSRHEGQVAGSVTIHGLAREKLGGKPSALVPDNDPARNIFYWKDLDTMAASVGLDQAKILPFFLDAGPEPVPGGLPIGGVTQIDLPNNHLQYALTWYGLALALLVVCLLSWLRRRRLRGL